MGIFDRWKKEKDAPDRAEGALDQVEQSEDMKRLARNFKKRYRAGVAYKQSQKLFEDWAEYQRFYDADQWPEPTPSTLDMPRPVTNHFASILDQKVAGLTYEMPEIYFDPVETTTTVQDESSFTALREGEQIEAFDIDAADVLSNAIKHIVSRIDLEELIEQGCMSAALLGTGIWYFPWDPTVIGGGPKSRYIGDIAGYEIDPVDFFPDDPKNSDIQSQPGIILAERRPLSEVKNFYKKFAPEIVPLLRPEKPSNETQVYDHQQVEQEDTDYVDVLHRWWKEEVEAEDRETPSGGGKLGGNLGDLIPAGTVLRYGVECQGMILRYDEVHYNHGLYPFVAFQWVPRRKSFWGKPDSADIINNQKEENRLAGIGLLSAYAVGLPNIRYNPDHVDEADIPLGPGGGIIKDNTPSGGRSIEYMRPPTPAAHIPQLRETLTAGMKEVTGVHEAWTGKAPSSQLNASAIIALQEAAGVRIRGIQRRLSRAMRDMGRLFLAHIKECYEEARLFRIVGDDKVKGFIWFKGTDYADMEFDVRVQSGNASPFSRTLYNATLDKLLETGIITGDEYLELLPADTFPKANKLIEDRKERQQREQEELAMQQIALVNHLIQGVITKAQQDGVPIDRQALSEMLSIVQNIATIGRQQEQGQPGAMPGALPM